MTKKIFFISHNQFAKGLKSSVEMIAGEQKNLKAYGLMPGGDPEKIAKTIEDQINDDDDVIILGDLEGGSVCNAALRLTTRKNVTLLTGTNLALALQVVLNPDKDALNAEINDARNGLKRLKLQVDDQPDSPDDFF